MLKMGALDAECFIIGILALGLPGCGNYESVSVPKTRFFRTWPSGDLTQILSNARGQSIVQVIVAGAIGLIILMALVASQINIARENRALTQSLARSDFQQQLIRSLSDGTLCTTIMTPPFFCESNYI